MLNEVMRRRSTRRTIRRRDRPGARRAVEAVRQGRLAPELVEELRRSKTEILRLLAAEPGDDYRFSADAAWWRGHFTIRTIHWGLSGKRTKAEAERLAYGELLDEWPKSHDRRWLTCQCAGCDEPIGGAVGVIAPDECCVQVDEKRECLIRFGRRWRSEAVAALQAVGLDPPAGFELL